MQRRNKYEQTSEYQLQGSRYVAAVLGTLGAICAS
jgi:hypothetical protein